MILAPVGTGEGVKPTANARRHIGLCCVGRSRAIERYFGSLVPPMGVEENDENE